MSTSSGTIFDFQNRCINCYFMVPRNRPNDWSYVHDASTPMLNLLQSWIAPTQVPPESILCRECFLILRNREGNINSLPALGHRSICFACGRSILRAPRTFPVRQGRPQTDFLLRLVPQHLISRFERICAACNLASTRAVQRHHLHDANRPTLGVADDPQVPEPPPLPSQSQGIQMQDLTQVPEPPPLPALSQRFHIQALNQPAKIESRHYTRIPSSNSQCVFPRCRNEERLLIPTTIKEIVLLNQNLYIPPGARICHNHLIRGEWIQLTSNLRDFSASQFDNMMSMMKRALRYQLDFSNILTMPSHLCHYWLGMNSEQFYSLLNTIPNLAQQVANPTIALCMYLVKLRTGDSNERLATLFNKSRTTLERWMMKARNCLLMDFLPLHLGFDHLTIEDVASRNRVIPEGFFGEPDLPADVKPAIVICDATYVFIQNSANYMFQKLTYSTQKGDVFLLDRGFRDVINELQQYGYETHMPESVLENHRQLTTLQANRTRMVTMCRWVVEVVNGRVKRDFRIFRHVYNNRAALHLMDDFKICCALLNKFHGVIDNPPEALEFVRIAKERFPLENHLADYVEREQLNRRSVNFELIDNNHPHLNYFPRLTTDDLKHLALGTYQLKQAKSYYGEHVRTSGLYHVEVNNEIEDDVPLILGVNNYMLRGRIKSRHISSRTYYIYLLISRDTCVQNTLQSIKGYCCNCLAGRRTVGVCAHVMTVVWYLSWGRYNDLTAPAQYLDEIFCEEYDE